MKRIFIIVLALSIMLMTMLSAASAVQIPVSHNGHGSYKDYGVFSTCKLCRNGSAVQTNGACTLVHKAYVDGRVCSQDASCYVEDELMKACAYGFHNSSINNYCHSHDVVTSRHYERHSFMQHDRVICPLS